MNARTTKKAFSLVELVIVVVIIGVIAAIAVPRISRGAKGAGDSALRGSLAALRNAIDMYAAEHGGDFPGGAAEQDVKDKLLKRTDANGVVGNVDGTHIYGPYLRNAPPLPVCANKNKVSWALVAGAPTYQATNEGWVYSTDTGEIIANCQDTEVDEQNVKYNSY